MIAVGLGLYLGYVPFNCVLFDRLVAAVGKAATAGFLIYVADASGYLGSVALLLYKSLGRPDLSWLEFFVGASHVTGIACLVLFVISMHWFRRETIPPTWVPSAAIAIALHKWIQTATDGLQGEQCPLRGPIRLSIPNRVFGAQCGVREPVEFFERLLRRDYRDELMTPVFPVSHRVSPVHALGWSVRHALGWGIAGSLVGIVDSLLAVTRPGTETLEASVLAATLTLDVALHIAMAACVGFAIGRPLTVGILAVWTRASQMSRRMRWRLLAAAGFMGLIGGALVWRSVGQWIEWDAVDWRLPYLGIGLMVLGMAASELPRRSRLIVIGFGLFVIGGVTGANLWAEGPRSTGHAAARLGETAASGRWLVAAARDALDRDGDGYPSGLCAGECDCNDREGAVFPGAAEVSDNGIDEDCDGEDLSRAATLFFEQMMVPESVAPPPRSETPTEEEPEVAQRPSILFVTVDTLRADHLGLYGYEKPTSPNLDELADRCAVFDQARATGSQTRFSVPPMVVGKYFTEIARTASKWPTVLEEETTIAERLQAGGYHTAAFHSIGYLQARFGFAQGFDHYDTSVLAARPRSRFKPTSDYVTDQVLDYVDSLKFAEIEAEKPFFLWAYYADPHSPYIFHKDFPSFGPWMKDVYDNEIAFTDHHIGRLLDGLDDLGLLENTLVVVTSDHGEGLDAAEDHGDRYHGPNLHDEVVRVPLMVCGAGVVPRRVSTPVSLIDLPSTFLDWAHIDRPDTLRGVSLGPWLNGRDPTHPPVFFEKHKGTALPQKGMVLWPYKVILKMAYNQVQIYDLSRDPRERFDLFESIESQTRTRLVGLLKHWTNEVLEVREPGHVRTAQR